MGTNLRTAASTPQPEVRTGRRGARSPRPARDAERDVESRLREQIPADLRAGVSERARRHGQPAVAGQSHDAIAQRLPLEQDEDDEQRDEARRCAYAHHGRRR